MEEKEKFMRIALKLAKKGTPSPNPYVGAVIVKNGKIIARGYHKKAGMPHAEIEALKNLKNIGAMDMYVNLEPCNHYGKTPPCTKALIKAGIRKVIFGMNDPNPNVNGGGEKELKKHGILVEKGILEKEAQKLNEVFIKYSETKMPFIVLKLAMSMDGKIATKTGNSKWITCEKSREYGHKLRAKYDAVLIGINTLLKDNPKLTSRIPGQKNPIRIILDSKLRIPLNAKVLDDSNAIIATTLDYNRKKRIALEAKNVKIFVCGKKRVNLKKLLKLLGKLGITSILVEGGAEVAGSFVDEKIVDKFILFFAPKIIGGKTAIAGSGAKNISDAIKLKEIKMKKIAGDFVFEAYPDYFA